MRKDETRDRELDMDYEAIRQVPVMPEGRTDRRRSRTEAGAGERVGSVIVGESRRNEDTDTGMKPRIRGTEGNTGEGERRRSKNVQTQRRSRSRGSRRSGETAGPAKASGQGSSGSGRRSIPVLALLLALFLGAGAGLGGGYYLWGWERPYRVDLKAVEVPDWVTQDFIRKNIFSRPDVSRKQVKNIVVHYVANPGSTAQRNRDYFDGLADQDPQVSGASASSHFIVGLEGEVIQCIPVTEIAYANAPRNDDTIAIEVCHPDETGRFNDATYESLVKLTSWLCRELKLSPRDVIRHYDVNGKDCPRYFVEDEDAWKQFLNDVKEDFSAL